MPRRILIYRIGSLGDTVVALPCFHLVARTYPDADRRLLTNFPVHEKAPLSAAILEGSGLVHGYMRYPVGLRSLRGIINLWREIRRYRPEILIYMAPPRGLKAARRDKMFFRLCGIRSILGVPDTEDLQKCRWLDEVPGYVRPEPPIGGLPPDIGLPVEKLVEPEAWRLARCLAPLGDARPQDDASWDLQLTEAEKAKARQIAETAAKPILAAAIGTKVQAKDWGWDNWQKLLTTLARRLPEHRLVLCGAASEAAESAAAATAWGERALNLCGQFSPRETAAVLAHAQLLLALDSGPMHLAASVGTPVRRRLRRAQSPGTLVSVWHAAPRRLSPHRLLGLWPGNLHRAAQEVHSFHYCGRGSGRG